MRCAICNDLEGCPYDCEYMELNHTCGKSQSGGEWILIHVWCEHEDVCKLRKDEDDGE